MEFPSYENNFVCCFPFSIEIKLAKLQNVLSRHITINVTEFILLHPDEINEDEQQESLVPYISVTLSDPDNCTLESDSDEDDEILSDDDGPVWESQQFIIEHIDSIIDFKDINENA